MGHTLAKTIATSPSQKGGAADDQRIHVAMVVPATSKGSQKGRDGADKLTALPVYEALLRVRPFSKNLKTV